MQNTITGNETTFSLPSSGLPQGLNANVMVG